jgi:excisionase family DNA binding protein
MEVQQEEEEPIKARKKAVKRKDVYSPSQVAEELNITRRTVYSWITEGKIPAFKIGVKLWGVRAHIVDALKEGRDVRRAENGFQAALLKKGVPKQDRDKQLREAKAHKEKRELVARLFREQQARIASAGRWAGPSALASSTVPGVAPVTPIPNVPASSSAGVAPMKNAGTRTQGAKGRRR